MFIGTFATAFALAFPYNARDLQHDLRAVIHIGGKFATGRRFAPAP